MTIVQLEHLIAVANYGNISNAAMHCFVTHSALSKQIALLEEELGVVLLKRNRNGKTIVPTEAGAAFLETAKKTVGMFYAARETVNEMKGQLSGKIRIAVIPTISPYLIPKFTRLFARRCPDVTFDIVDMPTADMVDALGRDEVEIGILSGGQSEIKIDETDLFDDRLLMYVSRENELYGKRSIEVDEIDVRKLLILSRVHCLRNQSLELCRKRREIELQYDFISSSLETLMHTADEIGGTTIIPGMAVGYIPEERRDRIIPFASPRAHRRISMAVGRTFIRESLIDAVRASIMDAHEELRVAEFLAE